MSAKKTTEQFRAEITQLGLSIDLVGEYLGANKKTNFKCSKCGHSWHTSPTLILHSGTGCPVCSEEKRREMRCLTLESAKESLAKVSDTITIIGTLASVSGAKTKFKCSECNTEWDSTPRRVIRSKGKCPCCGTKSGYQMNKVAFAYVVRFANFIKFGITNDPETRLSRHRQRGMTEVIECRRYANGVIPLQWENAVKKMYGGKFVTKEVLSDGWTETLSIDKASNVIEMLPDCDIIKV